MIAKCGYPQNLLFYEFSYIHTSLRSDALCFIKGSENINRALKKTVLKIKHGIIEHLD